MQKFYDTYDYVKRVRKICVAVNVSNGAGGVYGAGGGGGSTEYFSTPNLNFGIGKGGKGVYALYFH